MDSFCFAFIEHRVTVFWNSFGHCHGPWTPVCLSDMTSAITNRATSLLIFLSIVQGTQSVLIEHKTEVNASVGQNISLPCILSKEQTKIIQLQWHKMGEQEEQKLVVFNPAYSPIYYGNVELEVVNKTSSTELRGTILHLHNVTVKDSGDYVCDIATFPDGSIKSFTKVRVTVATVSMEVMPPDRTVVEGDTVNITCVCDPAPDKYMLLSPLSHPIMESQDGIFTIQSIQRSNSDLICQPFWVSSHQHLQSLKATVHLTVDFLDNIDCNSNSQIQVETGTNLTIACEAKSSKSLDFIWMKGNMIVSTNATLNLCSVSPVQSGNYTLIVHAENHSRLHRQKDFTVTVINSIPTAHLSSTMTMETTPQISSTTVTTPEPNVTMPTSQPHRTNSSSGATSTEEVMYNSTSAPSTGTVTMVHENVTTPHTRAFTTFTQTSDTSTIILTSASAIKATVRINNVLTTKVTKQDLSTTKSHAVFIIPFLLVLSLIAFLYRQYFIQKRLDMPPPFKPPPPPVKYISARNYDTPMTDILV
ncbi:nectin-2 isoform X2 [Silurus meridionalis]|uniref:nectin-2 isoform X2 n=1 Tax=Silurus meridionalis TaxID=175797 RepID=UPI001EEBC73F|nr:nectin-2 isoform X2 [Silurus meridionalis]